MSGVAITAGGLVTAVGFNATASCAAIRAGIRGVRETNLFDPGSGEPVPAGKVDLPQWSEGTEKLADLVAPAIGECLIAANEEPERIPILLGVHGSDRPHGFAGLGEALLDEIEVRLGIERHPQSGVAPRGQVSAALALRRASTIIEKGIARACVVAGVDSLMRQRVVDAYAQRRRVVTADNSNGFFPGEAGSAVLVCATQSIAGPRLEVLGMGFSREPAGIDSTDACRGEGLTHAIRDAVGAAGVDFGSLAFRVTDLNGEHYKFKEATFAVTRMEKRPHHEPFEVWHPIEYIGEVGAAIGPVALTVALTAGRRGYAPGEFVLFHFSSDDGERAAIVGRYSDPRGVA